MDKFALEALVVGVVLGAWALGFGLGRWAVLYHISIRKEWEREGGAWGMVVEKGVGKVGEGEGQKTNMACWV